ncbi:DUF6361 family protein [Acinetobacter junii]|uniref:DUF6361 family protein n=1 Tax=Acinetobacter junii TaxID=40215 RepID=UPI0009507362|nr:DUF6361 family protein [Acinetobacter junii]APU49029.1 hypothetical protein BVL33_11205 [Acinetobacter junii]
MSIVLKSSLSWIDNNKEAREKVLGLLSQFNEKDSRDELGIGSIRDRISDLLFPGTSTIQTRLRYFFFVPWLYQEAEKLNLNEEDSLKTIDQLERNLIITLMQSEDLEGVFGKTSGTALKRLPSSVYWSGLEKWGIKSESFSPTGYFLRAKELGAKRTELEKQIAFLQKRNDDYSEFQIKKNNASLWHVSLPKPPKNFPERANLKITEDEATFVKEQLCCYCSESLLTYLALNSHYASSQDVTAPWEHPEFENFDVEMQKLLNHAEFFSILVHGAYLLYNLLLADLSEDKKSAQDYENQICEWYLKLQSRDSKAFCLDDWSLDDFWSTIEKRKVSYADPIVINGMTKKFIETWLKILQLKDPDFYKSNEVMILIREREKRLKGARSRFTNKKALEQWGGASGVNELRYRWPTAKQFLKDLSVTVGG